MQLLNKFDALSARERQVVRELVTRGGRNADIGERLGLSGLTVKNKLTGVFKKMGVANRSDLVALAYSSGFAAEGDQGVTIKFSGESEPTRATPGSAGMDVRSSENKIIKPGTMENIGTGLHVEIPDGYQLSMRPRSGLAFKHQIIMVNSPGTIDSDYRGEIRFGLFNLGAAEYEIKKGERIGQALVEKVIPVKWEKVGMEVLSDTARGGDGFGSTGK